MARHHYIELLDVIIERRSTGHSKALQDRTDKPKGITFPENAKKLPKQRNKNDRISFGSAWTGQASISSSSFLICFLSVSLIPCCVTSMFVHIERYPEAEKGEHRQ